MSGGNEMTGTHDCGGDAAAYALGALDAAEAHAFRGHLEECAVCRDEVEALQGVVQALPMAAPQHAAPRRLRRQVMREIHAEARPGRRHAGRSATPALVAVAAAVILGAIVVTGVELSATGSGSGHLIQARVSGISGSAQLRVVDDRGELIVRHLSPPPAGHVYEVWLEAPGSTPVPASVLFSVSSSGSADVGLPGRLQGISQVMVTPEPDGGSPAPTHSPVIDARLT